jgi:hypothetical protein
MQFSRDSETAEEFSHQGVRHCRRFLVRDGVNLRPQIATPKTRPTSSSPLAQLLSTTLRTHVQPLRPFPSRSRTQLTTIKLSLLQHTAVSIVTSLFTLFRYYGNAKTHCHATVTVTLLWKCYKLTVMQQALLRYYGNATKDLTCHNM